MFTVWYGCESLHQKTNSKNMTQNISVWKFLSEGISLHLFLLHKHRMTIKITVNKSDYQNDHWRKEEICDRFTPVKQIHQQVRGRGHSRGLASISFQIRISRYYKSKKYQIKFEGVKGPTRITGNKTTLQLFFYLSMIDKAAIKQGNVSDSNRKSGYFLIQIWNCEREWK